MKKILIFMIKVYQIAISPLMASHCRFYPSCSCYAQASLEQHGAIKGLYLTIRRLGKCHPWHDGGIDPVPENFSFKEEFSFKNSK